MDDPDSNALELEQRLDEVVTAYLKAQEAGQATDRQALLDSHPDLASELREFFADQDRLERLASPLRPLLGSSESDARSTPVPNQTTGKTYPVLPSPPRSFGDYTILSAVGQGGMGVVWKARQRRPNRLVALKMFRAGDLASPTDVQRFRNEGEVIAQLDHPHILPVYEVGEHDGVHYFSMKLVEGGSLADHLNRFPADPRAAARLLATIARAVHYAHQRGILHRDLKPSNILLDAQGEPHVSDFGLAKRVETDSSLTQSGTLVGTPSYMAPEQTRSQKGAVTTATDVYGLGTVLNVLLTGRPPFQGETVLETLEQVREREPESPRRINAKVDRDLETICLKCLQKEPQRRYESAQALAEDLERWLKGEPIWARRSSSWERLRKWVRCRPAAATLVAVLVLAAVGLVGGLLWHDEQLQRAAEREKTEAERARHGRQLARQAVDRMYTEVATEWLNDEPLLSELQRNFLEEALHFYQELSQEEGDESALRQGTARAYHHVGDILAKLNRRAEAEHAYSQAIAIFSKLLAEHPDEPSTAHELAKTYRGMGTLMYRANRPSEADKFWRRGLETAEKLVHDHPNRAEYQETLGVLCQNLGTALSVAHETEKFLDRGRETFEGLLVDSPNNAKYHATLGGILNNFALWRMQEGKVAEARRLLEKAIEHDRQALKLNPRLKLALGNLRNNYSTLGGIVLPALGLHEEALKAAQEGLAAAQRLTADFPAVPIYEGSVADCQADVGRAFRNLGRLTEAEDALRQACNLQEKVIAQSPDMPVLRGILAETCASLGEVLAARGRDREAIAEYRRALENDPNSTSYKTNLAWALAWLGCKNRQEAADAVTLARQVTKEKPLAWQTWNALGGALYRAEQWNESVQALEKAMQLMKGAGPPPPHLFWAMAQWHLGNKKEARDRYRQVSQLMEKMPNWSAEWKGVHAEATTLLADKEQGTKNKEVSPKSK